MSDFLRAEQTSETWRGRRPVIRSGQSVISNYDVGSGWRIWNYGEKETLMTSCLLQSSSFFFMNILCKFYELSQVRFT